MMFRRSAPLILISAIFLMTVVTACISSFLLKSIMGSVAEKQLLQTQAIVESDINSASDRALARASMIASLPRIRALFAAQDRAALLAELRDMFAQQKDKYGIDQAQFHVLPATSYLRLQDPTHFGDDLSKFRPLVVAVNRDQAARKGFAIAYSGPAIFGVLPMYDLAQKHIGSFEMGIAFDGIINNLKTAYNIDATLYIDEAPLRAFAGGIKPDVLSDQNRVGKFIRYYSTNKELFSRLVFDKDLNGSANRQFIRELPEGNYGVVLVPLRNGKGETLGVVAVTLDITATRSATNHVIIWFGVMAFFSIICLAGLVIVIIRGVLLRPLESIVNRFAALSSADKPENPIPDSDTFCAELQGLIKQYDRLRIAPKKESE